MKGEIYIKATPKNVNGMDKYNIIDSVFDSLHMSDEDIMGYFIYRKVKKITLDD